MSDFRQLFGEAEAPAGKIVRAIASIGSVSASELVKSTGLARSTVSTLLNDLRERGIVIDGETRSAGFGRPTQMLSLNPIQGYCAGVLLGLGEIRIIMCDLAHNVLSDAWFELPRDYSPDDAAQCVRRQLDVECAKLNIAVRELLGVGLAVSAPVSYEGRILKGSVLPTWSGIYIAEAFSRTLDCPIYAENESHCGALAEMTWGVAVGEPNFVLFKFDLGVGGAIVIDRTVQRGAIGNAAEFGHITLNPQGPLCRCGNRGCLETYVGGDNLVRLIEDATKEKISVEQLVERARSGDKQCSRLVEDAAEMAGWAMGITSTILSPSLFVVAGKLASVGEPFMSALTRSFAKNAVQRAETAADVPIPEFVVGKFAGNDDTVLGAAALVLHQHGRVC
ncbi:MAG: hypothetical protein CML23_16645 [Rhizobiaceae bacterium]|nr:hypothetical protein [Rhizobiaceae bacterium]